MNLLYKELFLAPIVLTSMILGSLWVTRSLVSLVSSLARLS